MSNLQTAVSYAERGWYVAPVNVNYLPTGKKIVKFLVDWGKEASCDPDVVRDWYVQHPHAGTAIATKPSKLVVVDLDVNDDVNGIEAWIELCGTKVGQGEWTETYTVSTPSGGLHLYFNDPDGRAVNSASKLAPGIDIRGAGKSNGGVVFAPPTSTAKGGYAVLSDVPVADAPEWLWALIEKKAEPAASSLLDEEAPTGEPASEEEVLARIQSFRDELAGWGAGANDAAARLCYMAGQYAGAGQISVSRVTAIMLTAIDGWEFRGGSQETMENTIRAQVAFGSQTPRPWVAARRRELQNEVVVKAAVDFSNAAIAEHVADAFFRGKYVRTPGLGWLRWTGKYWRACDDSHPIEAVRKYARKQLMAAVKDGDLTSNAARGWAKYNAVSGVKSVLVFLGGMDGIYRENEEIDARHDVLNTPEGVLDLTTFEVRPHDPELLLTKITLGNYRRGATSDAFSTLLTAIPEDSRAWLQTMLGQGVSGRLKPRQPALLLTGGGRNGKSVLMETATLALGGIEGSGYAVQIPNELLLMQAHGGHGGAQPEKLMLRGARLAYIEETPEGRFLNVNALKKLVGTGFLTGRDLYRAPVTFQLRYALVINTNFPPRVVETDTATWDRLSALTFPFRFRKRNDDLGEWKETDLPAVVGLEEALRTQESLDAALSWLVDGYRVGRPDELETPESVARAVTAWRGDADILLRFLNEVFEFDRDSWVPTQALYAALQKWSEQHGQQKPPPSNTVISRIREHTGLPGRIDFARVLSAREGLSLPDVAAWMVEGENYRPSSRQVTAAIGLRFRKLGE